MQICFYAAGRRLLLAALSALHLVAYAQESNDFSGQTANLTDLPKELKPAQRAIENVLSYTDQTDPTRGQWLEAQAAFSTQFYKWFPTVSSDAKLARSKERTLQNSSEISSPSATEQLQFGINLRQNLFAAGADLKKQDVLNRASISAYLKHISARKQTVRRWMNEVIRYDHLTKLIQLNEEAQKQAQQLNVLAQRKEASGFLGRRDKLDSDREVLRTLQELEKNKSALARIQRAHLQTYGFPVETVGGLAAFKELQKLAEQYIQVPDVAELVQRHISKSLALSIAQLETSIAEGRLSSSIRSRLSPRIDLFAGLSERRNLEPDQTAQGQPNRAQVWQFGVTAELQLNPPQTFGSVQESSAQLSSARTRQVGVIRDLQSTLTDSFERFRQLSLETATAERLMAVTQTIRDQNQRLFEAGMISIDRLIVSQQDLDRDKKLVLSSQRDQAILGIDLALSDVWQLSPSGSGTDNSP